MLYRAVFLTRKRPKEYAWFTSSLQMRPQSFFSEHVKTLLLHGDSPYETCCEALRACTGLKNLACWLNSEYVLRDANLSVFQIMRSYQIRRLSVAHPINFHQFPFDSDGPPVFQWLTHFDLVCYAGDYERQLPNPALTPCLTHLSISLRAVEEPMDILRYSQDLIRAFSSQLGVVLVFCSRDPDDDAMNQLLDASPQILAVPEPDFFKDWVAFAAGGGDMWTRAERVIQAQREKHHRNKLLHDPLDTPL